ncbi:MAG: hypothetical protein J6N52_04095 [Clostridia bacterium]|nr:hypothetical protein [Clostridia bacterium]
MVSQEIRDLKKELLKKKLLEMDKKYDENAGLLGEMKYEESVIHSKVTGMVHGTGINREYVLFVFMTETEERYERAIGILKKLSALQDKNPESRTCGLWPYYMEESLEDMKAPDYNFAEFVGSTFIYIMKEKRHLIDDALAGEIEEVLRLAAHCCVRRNVGVDYTNACCMSVYTIIAAAEILKDDYLFEKGKAELIHFVEYTRFNGAFSEYNSPCYIQVAADSIAKMQMYFEDEECRKMADELNEYLWEMCASQYSTGFNLLTPPYTRVYEDIDEKEIPFFVYLATEGRYGSKTDALCIYHLYDISCPEKYYPLFEKTGWVNKTYYKKNNLREAEEDLTIVRDLESPDLTVYSYITDDYLFGSLQKSELWVQRRTLMTVWDNDNKKALKLCGLKNNFGFSSAMSYVAQNKNKAVALVGFCTDHGDKHYILDLFKDGKLKAQSLVFKLQLSGGYEGLRFKEENGMYVLSDGDFRICVKVEKWVYDGKEAEVRIADDGLELVCFSGEEREVDFNKLGETYGVLSYAINEKPAGIAVEAKDGKIRIVSENAEYEITGTAVPKTYNECMRGTEVIVNDKAE